MKAIYALGGGVVAGGITFMKPSPLLAEGELGL